MKWPSDPGLTSRVWLTMLLLLIVNLVFLSVLSYVGFGIYSLIAFAFILAFVQYFFSDRLVLWSTGAREVSRDEFPELHAMVEKLAKEADLPMPKVAVMQTAVPNAFATGRSPSHAVVAVTDSIVRLLTPTELEAVLAHEMSHVKNRDMLVLTIGSFMAMLASIVMQNAIFASMGGNRRAGGGALAWAVAAVAWVISTLLVRSLSRYREFAADRGSAYLTSRPRDLISALYKISGRIDYLPPEAKRQVEGANAFFIIPALSGNNLMELFSTHPPLEKRVAALEKVEQEIRR